jgi:hypothetical protein
VFIPFRHHGMHDPFILTVTGEDGGGGGGDESGDTSGDTGSGGDDLKVGEDGLTGRGRRALQQERQALRTVRGELRGWKAALQQAGISSPEELATKLSAPAPGADKPEVDVEKVRREAALEAESKANRRIALAEVRAAATGKFEDPDDAVSALSGDVDDLLGRDGNPDQRAISSALDDLLQRKPHFGKREQEQKPPDFDGGARGTAGAPASMDSFMRQISKNKQGR